jgi:hypothetical protein
MRLRVVTRSAADPFDRQALLADVVDARHDARTSNAVDVLAAYVVLLIGKCRPHRRYEHGDQEAGYLYSRHP